MNDNVKLEKPTVDNKDFANLLDKCGLQVSKSLTFDISLKEDEKKDGD